ncbi:MAG: DUF4188 domain-containing protein [Henriciella sp.]|jgi:hypothetical protein|nr:DUF4188 domain-containing protein [Henriciella sp.]
MPKPIPGRMTAAIEGDFVIFLIGMRIHKLWKVWKWFPVFAAMPKMLIELGKNPDLGLLHAKTFFSLRSPYLVQYWRSFEDLHAYSVNRDSEHLPAWAAFNRAMGTNGEVGIWHETYLIRAGDHESVYGNMPPIGLGIAGGLKPVEGRNRSAKGRLRQSDGNDQPDMDDSNETT